jgi:hypothetical protein
MPRRDRSQELFNLVGQSPQDWEVVKRLLSELKAMNDTQFKMFNASIRGIYAERDQRASNKFNVGDVIKFTARGGAVIYARVTGFGRRRLLAKEVTPKDHVPMLRTWKVSASFCTLVPIESKPKTAKAKAS